MDSVLIFGGKNFLFLFRPFRRSTTVQDVLRQSHFQFISSVDLILNIVLSSTPHG